MCVFLKSKVTYLGLLALEEGIQTDPEKIGGNKNVTCTSKIMEVRSFLGLTGYYRRFIENYTSMASPLNDLLVCYYTNKTEMIKSNKVKIAPFHWNVDQQLSFETLKEKKKMNTPILA